MSYVRVTGTDFVTGEPVTLEITRPLIEDTFQMHPEVTAWEAKKAAKRQRDNAVTLDGINSFTVYHVRIGVRSYRVERDHEPTRPEHTYKVYGNRNGNRLWIDPDGTVGKKVIRALRRALRDMTAEEEQALRDVSPLPVGE